MFTNSLGSIFHVLALLRVMR